MTAGRHRHDEDRSSDVDILLLVAQLGGGGAERQIAELSKGLQRRGHSVAIALMYPGGPLEQEIRDAGVPIFHVPKYGRWDIPGFVPRLILLLRRLRPRVLHSYLVAPNVIAGLIKPFIRRSSVVWGVRASDVDLTHYDRFARVTFWATRHLARFVDLIIVNSMAGLEHHAQAGYPTTKMAVVDNGIDTGRFRPEPSWRESVRAECKVQPSELVVGRVGRLDPMKGYEYFIDAAALVAQRRPDVKFVCVGDGPTEYRESLMNRARSRGLDDRMVWLAARSDIEVVYNGLDVCCSSSIFGEGFPNVVAEAMATGVPCAVTDVGDSARVVGSTGAVAPRGDANLLAEAIEHVLGTVATNREAVSRHARQRVVTEYSLDGLVDRTLNALSSIPRHGRAEARIHRRRL